VPAYALAYLLRPQNVNNMGPICETTVCSNLHEARTWVGSNSRLLSDRSDGKKQRLLNSRHRNRNFYFFSNSKKICRKGGFIEVNLSKNNLRKRRFEIVKALAAKYPHKSVGFLILGTSVGTQAASSGSFLSNTRSQLLQ